MNVFETYRKVCKMKPSLFKWRWGKELKCRVVQNWMYVLVRHTRRIVNEKAWFCRISETQRNLIVIFVFFCHWILWKGFFRITVRAEQKEGNRKWKNLYNGRKEIIFFSFRFLSSLWFQNTLLLVVLALFLPLVFYGRLFYPLVVAKSLKRKTWKVYIIQTEWKIENMKILLWIVQKIFM